MSEVFTMFAMFVIQNPFISIPTIVTIFICLKFDKDKNIIKTKIKIIDKKIKDEKIKVEFYKLSHINKRKKILKPSKLL